MHLMKMEEHQMTMSASGYIPLEKGRSLDFVCCIKMNLRLRPVAPLLRNNDEPTEHCIGTKRSRHDNSEQQNEARLFRNLAALSHKPQRGWEEDETTEDAAQRETVEEAGVGSEVEMNVRSKKTMLKWVDERSIGSISKSLHITN